MDQKTKQAIDKLTGAVPVDGDVTPTLRQEIKQVNANDWHKMSISELWEQRTTLNNRLVYAQQYAHPSIVQQLQNGLNTIDAILRSKEGDTDTRLL